MDELERELKALREATDRVAASPGLKSELLLAVSRTGAATTATGISVKIMVALVTAGAAGGIAVWSMTRAPEAAPPAPPPPVVEVNVNIAVPAGPAVQAQSSAPLVPGAAEAVSQPPARQPAPVVVSGSLAATLSGQLTPFACAGVRARLARNSARAALPADVRARVAALKHANEPAVVARVVVPNGRRAEEIFAPEPLSPDGWLVMSAPPPGTPIWFVLPGFEPVAYFAPGEGDVFLESVAFTPLVEAGEVEVRVIAPGSSVDVALTPRPCGGGLESAATLHESRSVFSLRGLPPIPWRIVARAPGSTTASVDVTPTNARTSVELRLEPARVVSFEKVTAPRRDLCRASVEQEKAVAGEAFLGGLRLKQKDRRVGFDGVWTLSGGFVGNGPLSVYCHDPRVTEAFGNREVRTGDVYALFDGDLVTLMRFTVQ